MIVKNDPQIKLRGYYNEDTDEVSVELPHNGSVRSKLIVKMPDDDSGQTVPVVFRQHLVGLDDARETHLVGKVKPSGNDREIVVIHLPQSGLYRTTIIVNIPQENDVYTDYISCYCKFNIQAEAEYYERRAERAAKYRDDAAANN